MGSERASRLGGRASREEVVKALGRMKAGMAAGPSEVSVEMIAASGAVSYTHLTLPTNREV